MAKGHGLRRLQMGEARHDGRRLLQRLRRKRELEIGELGDRAVDGVANIEAKIGRDLIVARARRMQSSGGGSDQLGEPRFDVHVNVFELARKDEIARLDLSLGSGISHP